MTTREPMMIASSDPNPRVLNPDQYPAGLLVVPPGMQRVDWPVTGDAGAVTAAEVEDPWAQPTVPHNVLLAGLTVIRDLHGGRCERTAAPAGACFDTDHRIVDTTYEAERGCAPCIAAYVIQGRPLPTRQADAVHFVPWGADTAPCGWALPPGDRDDQPVTDQRRSTRCVMCLQAMLRATTDRADRAEARRADA